jgi:hypothetical protein
MIHADNPHFKKLEPRRFLYNLHDIKLPILPDKGLGRLGLAAIKSNQNRLFKPF